METGIAKSKKNKKNSTDTGALHIAAIRVAKIQAIINSKNTRAKNLRIFYSSKEARTSHSVISFSSFASFSSFSFCSLMSSGRFLCISGSENASSICASLSSRAAMLSSHFSSCLFCFFSLAYSSLFACQVCLAELGIFSFSYVSLSFVKRIFSKCSRFSR